MQAIANYYQKPIIRLPEEDFETIEETVRAALK
jgi:hypothetical protein